MNRDIEYGKLILLFAIYIILLLIWCEIAFSYPDPNTLSPDMQWLVCQLITDENDPMRAIQELKYQQAKALEESDYNKDGFIDMQDYARFAYNYSIVKKKVLPVAYLTNPLEPVYDVNDARARLTVEQTKEPVLYLPNDPTDPCFIEVLAGVECPTSEN